MMDKNKVITAILQKLETELSALVISARAAYEAATHEESKAEDSHDTRGLEASYLAGAQASRVAELKQLIHLYRQFSVRQVAAQSSIAAGMWIETDLEGRKSCFFLMEQGGGISVEVEKSKVHVISVHAPLGEALLGKKAGDWVEVEAQNVERLYKIVAVG